MNKEHYSFAKRHVSSQGNYDPAHSSSERSRDRKNHSESSEGQHSPIFSSDDATSKQLNGRWTILEHGLFEQGLQKYGKDWKLIADLIKTRTPAQVRSHAQKYFFRVEKQKSKQVPRDLLQSGRSLRKRDACSIKSYDSNQNIMKTPPNRTQETNKHHVKPIFQHQKQETLGSENFKRGQSSRPESKTTKKHRPRNDDATTNKKQKINKASKFQVQQYSYRSQLPTLDLQNMSAQEYIQFMRSIPGQILMPMSYFSQFVVPALIKENNRFENLVQGQIKGENYDFIVDQKAEKQKQESCMNNSRRRLNFKGGLRLSDRIDIIQQKVEEEDDSKISPQEDRARLESRYSAFRLWQKSNPSK